MFGHPAITFVNAVVLAGDGRVHSSVRVRRSVVDAIGSPPRRGDRVVDVDGAVVLPGMVNAHDHLELNSFPRLKWRRQHANVREWIADFQPRFNTDPALAAARADTLADRVWVGGLKNLLSGVTTVCHHNPFHALLKRRFPVRVARRIGISHSLQIDGACVADSCRRTPADWPWIVHAAEGVDVEARDEVQKLQSLGCLGANTVLVHGVALDARAARQVLSAGASLVWCPTSNDFLFGATADVRLFSVRRRVALGTDSRLSGEGDLLDELRAAFRTRQLSAEALVRTVTSSAASVLRLSDAGSLALGKPADLVVLRRRAGDPFDSVVASTRDDVRLTMIGGVPLVGEPEMRPVFEARRERPVNVTVNGAGRLMASWIARRVAQMTLSEPGLEVC
ncbi:MAG TPA: amidohydrolase family protein [Vicinamibacterales bacterium]|nr:amidohydrolase family protein [Vicinamibacterales bacterium]